MVKKSIRQTIFNCIEKDPKITLPELTAKFDQVKRVTVENYFYGYRRQQKKMEEISGKIDLEELELQLSIQLHKHPTPAIVNACVRFLDLKKNMSRDADVLDLEKFFKKGKTRKFRSKQQ